MTWLEFTIAALVVYRLSLMTALESGPGRMFRKIRNICLHHQFTSDFKK